MSIKAKQIISKDPADEITPAFGFAELLQPGELIDGTPTVAEVGSSDLTISNVAKNTVAMVVEGADHAISEAVTMKITGGTIKKTYDLKVTIVTDATVPNTYVRHGTLKVV